MIILPFLSTKRKFIPESNQILRKRTKPNHNPRHHPKNTNLNLTAIGKSKKKVKILNGKEKISESGS